MHCNSTVNNVDDKLCFANYYMMYVFIFNCYVAHYLLSIGITNAWVLIIVMRLFIAIVGPSVKKNVPELFYIIV